jgi:dTDP-glucose 4,6-dehydratase
MTKRLLLTGGTGFFGRALLRHFHAQAKNESSARPRDFSEIIVISRNPEAFASRYPDLAYAPWLRFLTADVCQRHSLEALLIGEKLDAVLHAATDSTDAATLTPVEKLDQIVNGTRNVLELTVRLRARRFLLTSSGGVYGPQPAEMEEISENYCGMPDPLQMSSTYGVGKRMAEHLCFLYGQVHSLEIVIARCFAFVGPDLPLEAHFAIGNFIRDALHRPAILIGGDGTPVRSFLEQGDLAHWLLVILKHGRAGQAYNVGSDQAITIQELANQVRDLLAPNKPVHIQKTDLGGHRNRYVPSIKKATDELDLRVSVLLSDAILATVKGLER